MKPGFLLNGLAWFLAVLTVSLVDSDYVGFALVPFAVVSGVAIGWAAAR